MNSAALAAEMRACLGNLRREHAEFLVSYGLDPVLIVAYQLIGAQHIAAAPGGKLWVPDENGPISFVTPVRVHESLTPLAPDPFAAVRFGEIIDLVAWCPKAPDQWLLRTGNAMWIGAAPLPAIDPFPVKLRATVINWMRAGAEGIAILTKNSHHKANILSALDNRVVVESAKDRRELSADLATGRRSLQPQLLLSGVS